MSENLSPQLRFSKIPVRARGGVVSAQNRRAAEIGAAVLADGGNAADAAVATGFALAALEPWMSGLGGIGFATIWDAGRREAQILDYGAVSARRLDPRDYPLTGAKGGDLFGWPEVADNRNVNGAYAVAVPGQVAGLAELHRRLGSKPWAALLDPAVQCAVDGIAADWWACLLIAATMAPLARDPASAAWFLPGGFPPAVPWEGPPPRLKNPALAASLTRLRDAGPPDFQTGELARRLAADLARAGSAIRADDLADYRARWVAPLAIARGECTIFAPPGLTAGPSLAECLAALDPAAARAGGTAAALGYAEALSAAYGKRLQSMGENAPGAADACTTHFSIVDAAGNAVAWTQTLLSIFGARLTLPETGILMNNGVNWFDPVPGRPNSIGPGKRPLCNMLPTVTARDGRALLALGASGGRRILPAVFQLLSFIVDRGLDLRAAMHLPRIDVSAPGQCAADPLLDPPTQAALAARFGALELRRRDPFPLGFACPVAAAVDPVTGERIGLTEIAQPWAASAGAG
jgi:gamma-glutamyltranspeptidase/glutathione hydrolase